MIDHLLAAGADHAHADDEGWPEPPLFPCEPADEAATMNFGDPKTALEAARSPDARPQDLALLAQSPHGFVREAVARHPATAPETLEALVPRALEDREAWHVAQALFENPHLPADLARLLVARVLDAIGAHEPRNHEPWTTVAALATAPTLPADAIARLANPAEGSKHLRLRLAHRGASRTLLNALLQDPSERVRTRAKKALEHD